jgi:hypothetical protein
MSGDNTDAADQINQRLDDQQKLADVELENRRQALTRTRMDLIKSTGQQQWINPEDPTQTDL